MHLRNPGVCALLLAALLSACGGGEKGSSSAVVAASERSDLPAGIADGVTPASCRSGKATAGGQIYRVAIPSRVDGEAIVFQVFEPDTIDCSQKHALILEGHGYSGSRQTSKGSGASPLSFGAPLGELTKAGYAVISIDQRGSGESGGTVRVMDPDFEGQDLIAIVDWAEQHLDYLKYRDGNLLLGATGGSYGGGYQMLLLALDPARRLDAIVPEITWHDLTYSIAPNDVVKSYWALFLAAAGDGNTQLGQDPFIRGTLIEGAVTGKFPESALPFFNYHSPSYFCENPRGIKVGDTADVSGYTLGPLLGNVPLTAGDYTVRQPSRRALPKVDALLFQSPRDDLFNFNEAVKNYECLKRGGGDVRLLSYEVGHGAIAPDVGLVQQTVAAQTVPLGRNCGPIAADQAVLAWFDEKLLGKGKADRVITTKQNICYSLTQSDAVQVPTVTRGGTTFPVAMPGDLPVPVTLAQLAPTIVPLTTIGNASEVIAGIPRLKVTVGRGVEALDDLCMPAMDPLLRLGSCDSTIFVGLGVIPLAAKGSRLPLVPELLDEQVIPLRGFGEFEIDMVAVAERLVAGDQLVLMVYGNQQGFLLTSSRDLSTLVATIKGEVSVPMLGDLPSLAGDVPAPAMPGADSLPGLSALPTGSSLPAPTDASALTGLLSQIPVIGPQIVAALGL